jgi:anaerobic ribonucleoside-triphosphate reductase
VPTSTTDPATSMEVAVVHAWQTLADFSWHQFDIIVNFYDL